MVSKAKLYSQLDIKEDELEGRIIPHLERAANGKNDLIFCTAEFAPFPELRYRSDPETESLIQLGRQILALREKLGDETEDTIAARLCWYCRKWGDTTDQHAKAAQALAVQFLTEIRGDKP
ncbi:MAG: hypothetical protein AB8B48_19075 [Pseudomonadales bacterium]